jgi:hypothetical protein
MQPVQTTSQHNCFITKTINPFSINCYMLRPDPAIMFIIQLIKISHVVYHIYHFMDGNLILQITLKFINFTEYFFYRTLNNYNTKYFVNSGKSVSGTG